jgi:hypothetical protein
VDRQEMERDYILVLRELHGNQSKAGRCSASTAKPLSQAQEIRLNDYIKNSRMLSC